MAEYVTEQTFDLAMANINRRLGSLEAQGGEISKTLTEIKIAQAGETATTGKLVATLQKLLPYVIMALVGAGGGYVAVSSQGPPPTVATTTSGP